MANPWKNTSTSFAALSGRASPTDHALSFPALLHRRLHRSPNTADIVSFQSHGRAFRIHDEERFQRDVLPVWFDNLSWDDFLSELHRYGFRRMEGPGPDQGAYYHEMFLSSQTSIARRMTPRSSSTALPPYDPEPDFSQMPVYDSREITNPFAPFAQVAFSANAEALVSSGLRLAPLPQQYTPCLAANDQTGDGPGQQGEDLVPTPPSNDSLTARGSNEEEDHNDAQEQESDEKDNGELPN